MKHDSDFFIGLAQISETVAATALDQFCAQSDRRAIEAFMEAVVREPALFPDTRAGKKLPLHVASSRLENEPNNNQSTFEMIAMSVRQDTPETPFSPDKLAHFQKIVEFAGELPRMAFEPFKRLAEQLAKHSTDAEPFRCLADAAERTGRPLDRYALVKMAMEKNNLGAVLGFLSHLDDAALIKAMPALTRTVKDGSGLADWSWCLGKSEIGSHEHNAAHRLFQTLEERVGIHAIAPLRLALLSAQLQLFLKTDEVLRARDFFIVAGLENPDQAILESLVEAMDEWHDRQPVDAQQFAHDVVYANLVELLPVVGFRLEAGSHRQQPNTTPGTALDGAFKWSDGSEGARRLKETLAFLEDVNHDLSNFGNGTTLITHIAQHKTTHLIPTLAVLLEMGCDPEAKDGCNDQASFYVHGEQRAAWNHVVNAHKARATAHNLIGEMDLSP